MKPEGEDSDSDESHDADNAIAKLDYLFPSRLVPRLAMDTRYTPAIHLYTPIYSYI